MKKLSKQPETIQVPNPASSKKPSSSPHFTSMDEMLKAKNYSFTPLKRGDRVSATVIAVNGREVVTNIGAKSFGVVVGREFEAVSQMVKNIHPGDVLDAEVIIPEMESGDTLISLKRTLIDSLWEQVEQSVKNHQEIAVIISKIIHGGYLVEYKSLRGFIPQAQLDEKTVAKGESGIGSTLRVQVLEANQRQNRLVLSEIEVTQKEHLVKVRKALDQFITGDVIAGSIISIDDYTISVHVTHKKVKSKKVAVKERVEAIVHISEISWERVDDIAKRFSVGDEVEAKVISVDSTEGKLALSIKQMTPDPWDDIASLYKEEQQVPGVVTKISTIGIFIQLEKGIQGLIHISKMPADKEFKVGEKITVTIDKLDKENRKISLSYIPTSKPIGYR